MGSPSGSGLQRFRGVPVGGAAAVIVPVIVTVPMGVPVPVIVGMSVGMSVRMSIREPRRGRLPVVPGFGLVGTAFRLERQPFLADDQVHAAHQRGEHGIGFELEMVRLQLHRDMPVAQMVGGAQQIARRAVVRARAHYQHRLRGGLHADQRAVVGHQHVSAAHDAAARQEHAKRAAQAVAGVEAALAARVPVKLDRRSAFQQCAGKTPALRDELVDGDHGVQRQARDGSRPGVSALRMAAVIPRLCAAVRPPPAAADRPLAGSATLAPLCRSVILASQPPMKALPPRGAARRKRVLVVQYSQSGQLAAVLRALVAPLQEAVGVVDVHIERLQPQPAYPFPWTFFRFLDAFPESALLQPPALSPLTLTGDEDFDLVILPYQVWFLAPSPPVTAFLRHPAAQRLLRGRPVVTVIACRNMWLTAQEKMKTLLAACGARLIDNVVLTDPGPTLATFITTPRWLLTGRRDALWGLPPAGLAAAQIAATRRFGLALRDALAHDAERGSAPLLSGLGAVRADPRLYISEKAGTRSFFVWGRLLRAAGRPGSARRLPLLLLYVAFLVVMIVTVVPTSLLVQRLLRPGIGHWLLTLRQRFELPSGSATDRLAQYED